jgi:hypothetical protein
MTNSINLKDKFYGGLGARWFDPRVLAAKTVSKANTENILPAYCILK